ncbi:MAG: lysostaphin resistance A-like protein [Candidatus Coprovivens sp.]
MKIKKNNNKTNIFLLFLRLLIVFIIFDLIITNLPRFITLYIIKGKYLAGYIVESLAVIFGLIIMLVFGNSYIFKSKKMNIFQALALGVFPLGISSISFISDIIPALSNSVPNVISLAAYCISIGLFEEFVCRGWLQTEFIERYSNNPKQVKISILLASLIFGGMHITNIWIGSQTILETILQIIQATGMGFLLGSIFYRSKNIWSVVFIHAFWDFSLMLSESMNVKQCTYGNASPEILTYVIITTIVLTMLYFLVGLYIIRNNKIKDNFEDIKLNEKKEKIKESIIVISMFAIIFFPIKIPDSYDEYRICYTYETISFENYEIIYQHKSNYTIELTYNQDNNSIFIPSKIITDKGEIEVDMPVSEELTLKIEVLIKDGKAYIIYNEKEYELDYKNIYDLEIVNNNIILLGIDDKTGDSILYYNNYLTKENLSQDNSINTIISSFEEYDNLPYINKLGIIHNLDDDKYYPLFESKMDSLIIDEKEILLIK